MSFCWLLQSNLLCWSVVASKCFVNAMTKSLTTQTWLTESLQLNNCVSTGFSEIARQWLILIRKKWVLYLSRYFHCDSAEVFVNKWKAKRSWVCSQPRQNNKPRYFDIKSNLIKFALAGVRFPDISLFRLFSKTQLLTHSRFPELNWTLWKMLEYQKLFSHREVWTVKICIRI